MKARRAARRHPGRTFADLYEGNAMFDAHHYAEAGAPFIVHKATQGAHHVDARHALRSGLAHELGLAVGHYHFLDLSASAEQQADHFWAQSKAHWAPRDFLIVDCERGGVGTAGGNVRQFLIEFDHRLHRVAGRTAIGYSEQSFLHEHELVVVSRKWWVADYGANPSAPPRGQELWAHQFTDKGRIAGCAPPTDLSVLVAKSAIDYWDR